MSDTKLMLSAARHKTYTISQLAKEFDVTPRALRFYEDKGLLSPARDGMARVYTNTERARLKLILSGRKVGFSLNDIREILDLYNVGDNQRTQLRRSYKKHQEQLEILKKQRIEIDEAVTLLQEGIAYMEEKLSKLGPTDDESESARAFEAVAKRHLTGDDDE